MLDFITRFFKREEASKTLAKERLRLVLMSDRVSLAPDIFDEMKGEMLAVIRRYLEIDERALAWQESFARRGGPANLPYIYRLPEACADASYSFFSVPSYDRELLAATRRAMRRRRQLPALCVLSRRLSPAWPSDPRCLLCGGQVFA